MAGTLSHIESATAAVLWPGLACLDASQQLRRCRVGCGRGCSAQKYATQCCTLTKLHFQFVSGRLRGGNSQSRQMAKMAKNRLDTETKTETEAKNTSIIKFKYKNRQRQARGVAESAINGKLSSVSANVFLIFSLDSSFWRIIWQIFGSCVTHVEYFMRSIHFLFMRWTHRLPLTNSRSVSVSFLCLEFFRLSKHRFFLITFHCGCQVQAHTMACQDLRHVNDSQRFGAVCCCCCCCWCCRNCCYKLLYNLWSLASTTPSSSQRTHVASVRIIFQAAPKVHEY